MFNNIKEKLKANKWWMYIPILGPMAFAIRFEFSVNKEIMECEDPSIKKRLKLIKKKKSLANIITMALSLPFVITFFVMRNNHGYGSFPWFIYIPISLAVITNIVPQVNQLLYKKGFENSIKKEVDE